MTKLENVKLTNASFYEAAAPYGFEKLERPTFRATLKWSENTHLELSQPRNDFISFNAGYRPIITCEALADYPEFKRMLDMAEIRNIGRDILFRGATVNLIVVEFEHTAPHRRLLTGHAVREVIITDIRKLNDPLRWQPIHARVNE